MQNMRPRMKKGDAPAGPKLLARRLRLHTHREAVVVIRTDSPIARAEGLGPHSQILLRGRGREARATLFQVEQPIIGIDEAALSEAVWQRLGLEEGDMLTVSHASPLESLACVRHRIHGHRLSQSEMDGIVRDVAAGNYADVHLAAFLTASSAMPLDEKETYFLARAMVESGECLQWSSAVVVDKHCLGGLPGNRTTPIIVAIAAACGLTMPKTSSRAITSPAGTADTMAMLAPVDLDIAAIKRVVAKEGGCLAWGGAVSLAPADDIFIGIERTLDIDTEGQLIASVLSKKVAAGATHVVIDIPVGPTAKVRSRATASAITERLAKMAECFGIKLVCVQTDGSQPVGYGVGPALEAMDVLAVLQDGPDAPHDLRSRACFLAGAVLELGSAAPVGGGTRLAEETLLSGKAWQKFERICMAQGGMRQPGVASLKQPVLALHSGRVIYMDNRKIAQLAKLAGAPDVPTAGVRMQVRLGDEVAVGEPLLTVHAEAPGHMNYALAYARSNPGMVEIG
ncbi:thymidine phosphorylase family protein [Allosphingosinicella humi]